MSNDLSDIFELLEIVMKFFDGDEAKVTLWFQTKNPMLGGVSPREMIDMDRCDKLLRWAKEQLSQNEKGDETQ